MTTSKSNKRPVPPRAISLIRGFEGLHDRDKRTPALEAMPDPIGIYTIGWGHALVGPDGTFIRNRAAADALVARRWPRGMMMADADALLAATAQEVCEDVLALLPGVALADHELAALISFAYNVGIGGFGRSTARKLLRAGNRKGAAEALMMWNKAEGKVLGGLVKRREIERDVFLGKRP